MSQIRRVAVLGAGVMGSGIAAHLANARIPCLLLDIVPPQGLTDDDRKAGLTEKSPAFRNRFAAGGKDKALKSSPAAFFTPADASLVDHDHTIAGLLDFMQDVRGKQHGVLGLQIAQEIAHFTALGLADEFEWKLFGHDQPADLRERLIRHGFEVNEPADAVMALDLSELPPKLAQPVTHDVRRVTDERGLADIYAVIEAVWPEEDHSVAQRNKITLLREHPESISMYAAYVEGQPVCEGWIDFPETDFAGLWGGATLSEYRNRGLYTALVAVRAQEAQRRGYRFLTIDASPMSRAVLEKQGFVVIASAWECNYRGAAAAR